MNGRIRSAARQDRPDDSDCRIAELEAEIAMLRRELARGGAGGAPGAHAAGPAGQGAVGHTAPADAEARHSGEVATGRADPAAGGLDNEALLRANADLAASRAALRGSEEGLRLVLDSAADYAIFATDLDRRVVTWSAGAERLLGWSGEEIVGRSADAFFTPEDRAAEAPEREAARALAEGRAVNERWHVRKDGSRFWGSGLVTPLRDPAAGPGAPPLGLLKVMRDRTEQQRAEEALRGRERRLRLLADTAAGLLAAADPDEVLRPVFRSLSEEFGVDISFSYVVDEGEGGGLRLASCFGLPEEARAGFARLALGEAVCGAAAQARRAVHVADARASDDPAAAAIRALGVRAYVAFPLVAGGGRLLGTISFGSRARACFSEEETAFLGAIAHHVGVVRERLRAEEALRESERRLRATQDHAGVGIHEVDAEGRYARINGTFTRMSGYAVEDFAGRAFWEFVEDEEGRRGTREAFERLVRGEADSFSVERPYTDKRGRRWWADVTTTAIRDEGRRFLYAVRVVQDTTERRRAEERKTLLLHEMNHRVKNTLAVVQSLALQTARGAVDLPSFSAAFQTRLIALARAHDLLTRTKWEGAPLADVARAALAPDADGDGGRVDLDACVSDSPLPPSQALTLALALHELATNALKHGALSAPGGRVSVSCGIDPGGSGAQVLEWVERGGPPVHGPPARRGFGLRLLQRGLAAQSGMGADLRFEREGLRCTLRLPPAR